MKRFLLMAFAAFTVLAADTSCRKDSFYTVTFKSQGGSPVTSQWVHEGSRVRRPDDPTKDGYTFAGWYVSSRSGSKWDFNRDVVRGNLTLYAQWQAQGLDFLIVLIARSDALVQADYTAASWDSLQTALTAAKGVAANSNATTVEISSALAALQTAFDNLVRV